MKMKGVGFISGKVLHVCMKCFGRQRITYIVTVAFSQRSLLFKHFFRHLRYIAGCQNKALKTQSKTPFPLLAQLSSFKK